MSSFELKFWIGALVALALCVMILPVVNCAASEAHAQVIAATQQAPATQQSIDGVDPAGILVVIFDALKSSQWQLAGFAVLLALLWILRFTGYKIHGWIRRGSGVLAVAARAIWIDSILAWIGTDRGGSILAILMGAVLAVVNGLLAGQGDVLDLIKSGLVVGLGAMGLWSGGRRILPAKVTGRVAPPEQ